MSLSIQRWLVLGFLIAPVVLSVVPLDAAAPDSDAGARAAAKKGDSAHRTQAVAAAPVLGDPSSVIGAGSVQVRSGRVEARPVEVRTLQSPPQLLPKQLEDLSGRKECGRLSLPPIPGAPEAAPLAAVPATALTEPNAPSIAGADEDLITYVNARVKPPNAATSRNGSPSVANNDRIVFQTGNWYGAMSYDDGQSWEFVDPTIQFPPRGGGLCCNQQVVYDSQHGDFIWALQYIPDEFAGAIRIAVSQHVPSPGSTSWCIYDFIPADLGLPSGLFFDFPNLTLGANNLYVTVNVFEIDTFLYQDSVILRIPLANLATCGAFSFDFLSQYYNQPEDKRASFRVCEGIGTTAYWAAHNSTTSIRIYRWDESSGSIFWNDVAHDDFSTGPYTCTGPDGVNTCARADQRILAAFRANGQLGFMWNSAAHGARPYPYTDMAIFAESDRSLIQDNAVWSPGHAWIYPSVGVNDRGHVAGTIFATGGALRPTLSAWVVDDINTVFSPLHNIFLAGSTHEPADGLWGDYLTSRAHSRFGDTWIGSGFVMNGGANNDSVEPRYAWFGRRRDMPPPRPANDDCTNAIEITTTPYTSAIIDTVAASVDGLDPDPTCTGHDLSQNSNSVWFRFTPPCDGLISVSTCNSNYDTVLTVYNDDCGAPVELACNDDSCGVQSALVDVAVSGQRAVLIEVANYGAPGGGNLELQLDFVSREPDNNSCSQAIPVMEGVHPFCTYEATTDGPAEPGCGFCCNDDQINGDVWYCYQAGCTGTAKASLCDADFDTKIAVYEQCGCVLGSLLTCNDDADCGFQSEVTFEVEAGQQYGVRVGSFLSQRGQGKLAITCTPANDICPAAEAVSVPGFVDGSTRGLTVDLVPTCGDCTTAPGIWYRVIGTGHTMTATTCNAISNYDTRLSVFCAGCDELTCVADNDDACGASGLLSTVSWCSQAGAEYWILVHGYSQYESGEFRLELSDDGAVCEASLDCSAPFVGACCTQGSCRERSAASCARVGGTYLGGGTSCQTIGTCPSGPTSSPTVYGIDATATPSQALISFAANDPSVVTPLGPVPPNILAMDFPPGVFSTLYGITDDDTSPSAVVEIDPATGAAVLGPSLPTPSSELVVGASFHPQTAAFMVLSADSTVAPANQYLYAFDPASWQPIGGCALPQGAQLLTGLAIDGNGVGYVIDLVTDTLVRVNVCTCDMETVGPLGVAVNLIQALDFDDLTGDLYAALYDDTTPAQSGLFLLDTTTGAATLVGPIGVSPAPGEPRVPAIAVGPRPHGACCLGDGVCADGVTLYECAVFMGLYGGDDSECATVSCPIPGACCLPPVPPGMAPPIFAPPQEGVGRAASIGNCDVVLEAACTQANGMFQGEQTICAGDTDGDGFNDNCEQCPNDPDKVEPGVCGCGVPDVDSDNDGLLDCVDDCPFGIDVDGNGTFDHLDFAELVDCLGGPSAAPILNCGCFDVEEDGDVDMRDVHRLMVRFGQH